MTLSGFYQQNKQKFTDLFVDSKDLLLIEFNKNGEILFANRALKELLGWNMKNLKNIKISNIFEATPAWLRIPIPTIDTIAISS